MTTPVTFFYDYLSPYSYLAYHQIKGELQNHFQEVIYRPVAILAVMKEVNNTPTTLECPAKAAYAQKDLVRWAVRYRAPFAANPFFGQFDPTPLYLGAVAADKAGQIDAYNDAVFKAVWVDGVNLGDEKELLRVLQEGDIENPAQLLAQSAAPETAERLQANNAEAIACGVFGVPSFLVGEELFFGNDRLDFVLDALSS